MRWLRALALLLILSGIAAGLVVADYVRFMNDPMEQPEGADDVLNVEGGTSMRRLAEDLADTGWIDRPLYFRLSARVNDIATRIQAGEYRLEAGESPRRLLTRLVDGDVIRYRLAIINGWTFEQMRRAVESHEAVEVTLDDVADEDIMERLGRPEEHPEGWFYPDTYTFERGTSDLELYRRAHRRMERILAEEWDRRSAAAPVESPYEALILASIIERETGIATERARVAGVFAERLDIGMRLQTDPTVIYGLGDDYEGRLRYRHLREDTPYNTYTRAGLPPTPISLPGQPSLHAALNPDRRGELYFVATGDGGHKFSETLEEHNEAVIEYQLHGEAKRLRGANTDRE